MALKISRISLLLFFVIINNSLAQTLCDLSFRNFTNLEDNDSINIHFYGSLPSLKMNLMNTDLCSQRGMPLGDYLKKIILKYEMGFNQNKNITEQDSLSFVSTYERRTSFEAIGKIQSSYNIDLLLVNSNFQLDILNIKKVYLILISSNKLTSIATVASTYNGGYDSCEFFTEIGKKNNLKIKLKHHSDVIKRNTSTTTRSFNLCINKDGSLTKR